MPRQFQVDKTNLADYRLIESAQTALNDGEIRVQVERFALTTNNITYGVVGEKIGYWKFFPAADNANKNFGMIPVWGFGKISESKHADLEVAERFYGYFPMADELIMVPGKVKGRRIVDTASHRAELPPVYNAYTRLSAEPGYDSALDNDRMLLYPLYATSYCIYDFLLDNDWFGAEQVIVISASSKTAIGTAIALHDDANAPKSVALTSPSNMKMVRDLMLYNDIFSYEELEKIDRSKKSVIIDMSGNGSVLSTLHHHLADNMIFCSNVGVTHYDDNNMGPEFIRERSAMFFAPGHIQKRTAEWGPGVFEGKAFDFWKNAAGRSQGWLTTECINGLDETGPVYNELLTGRVAPSRGLVVEV